MRLSPASGPSLPRFLISIQTFHPWIQKSGMYVLSLELLRFKTTLSGSKSYGIPNSLKTNANRASVLDRKIRPSYCILATARIDRIAGLIVALKKRYICWIRFQHDDVSMRCVPVFLGVVIVSACVGVAWYVVWGVEDGFNATIRTSRRVGTGVPVRISNEEDWFDYEFHTMEATEAFLNSFDDPSIVLSITMESEPRPDLVESLYWNKGVRPPTHQHRPTSLTPTLHAEPSAVATSTPTRPPPIRPVTPSTPTWHDSTRTPSVTPSGVATSTPTRPPPIHPVTPSTPTWHDSTRTPSVTPSPTTFPSLRITSVFRDDSTASIRALTQTAVEFWQRALVVAQPSNETRLFAFERLCTEVWSSNKCATYQNPSCSGKPVHATDLRPQEHCPTNPDACVQLTGGVGRSNTDTLIYLYEETASGLCDGGTVAYAVPCSFDPVSTRPTAGAVTICKDAFDSGSRERNLHTLVHEIGHILGFHSGLFIYYLDRNNGFGPYGYNHHDTIRCPDQSVVEDRKWPNIVEFHHNRSVLTTPTLRSYAQLFFDCTDLQGVDLENAPTAANDCFGSHFEERVFPDATMSAIGSWYDNVTVVTPFLFALMFDTGWYNLTVTTDQLRDTPSVFNHDVLRVAWPLAGRDGGCEAATKECSGVTQQNGYFCTPDTNGCDPDGRMAICLESDVEQFGGCGVWGHRFPAPPTNQTCTTSVTENTSSYREYRCQNDGVFPNVPHLLFKNATDAWVPAEAAGVHTPSKHLRRQCCEYGTI